MSDEREQREKCQRDRFNEGQFRAFAASEESKHAVWCGPWRHGATLTARQLQSVPVGRTLRSVTGVEMKSRLKTGQDPDL